MSEYQYHEFCSLHAPLTAQVTKKMRSLSSRACVGTHGASYVYNYGDFGGDPEKLLRDYFDVYFHIANWGTTQLMFKYAQDEVDRDALMQYCIDDVITCKQAQKNVILNVCMRDEHGYGWIDGEGILPKLVPLHEELKDGNYQLLALAAAIHEARFGESNLKFKKMMLSSAQKAFLDSCLSM